VEKRSATRATRNTVATQGAPACLACGILFLE